MPDFSSSEQNEPYKTGDFTEQMSQSNYKEGEQIFLITERIYINAVLKSDIKVTKGSMSAVIFYFQFNIFLINILQTIY